MERALLLIVVTVIVIGGIAAGGASLAYNTQDHWTPRDYVADSGECFVPPQGDPLYDAHYAQEVNKPNCEALKTQSESKMVDAQARNLNTRTNQGILGMSLIGIVLLAIVGFFVWAILR